MRQIGKKILRRGSLMAVILVSVVFPRVGFCLALEPEHSRAAASSVFAPEPLERPPVSPRNHYTVSPPTSPVTAASMVRPNAPVPIPTLGNQLSKAVTVPAVQASFSEIAVLPKRPMTLAEISGMATRNHPGIQQAARQADALRGAWVQAGLKPNPTIGYSAEEMTEDGAGKQGVTFSQPITPKYKRDARQSTVSREYQVARQTQQIQNQKAVNDAMLAAYRVVFSYRKWLIFEELTRISQESQRAGSELLKAEEIGRSAFLDIKIQAERTQIALADGEIAYRTACKELAILISLPENELIEITDSIETLLPELNAATLLAEIQAASPELRQAYAEVEAAKARVQQQCAEAGIDYETSAQIAYNTETKQGEFSFGVAVPLRLFDRNQGNIKQAQSELAASYRNVERLERLITQKYERQWGEYQTARNRVVSYKEKILSEARESLDLALAAYRRGEYGSLELLDAQRTLSTVQIEYLDNLNALMESQVLLQGALLTGGLEKPGTE